MWEFFGLANYHDGEHHFIREAEGAWSAPHLLLVAAYLIVMAVAAVLLGRRYRTRTEKEKNRVLLWAAILIDSVELVKIAVLCIRTQDPLHWLYVLPLFLCSLQLVAIPLAALTGGRLKEACLDFVLTFGIPGAVFGTVGATQNYSAYPALSMDNVFSGITHAISGFASLYIALSGMISLRRRNLLITLSVLLGFSVVAYAANLLLDYNYMFLMYHDGTPYSIVYDIAGGSPVLYPLLVVLLFAVYLILAYALAAALRKRRKAE